MGSTLSKPLTSSFRWQLCAQHEALSKNLAQRLSISTLVSQVLLNRGVSSLVEAQAFLGSSNPYENDQLEADSLKRSSDIVSAAIADKKRILVWGDYDVDGMTSVSLMVTVLKSLGANVVFHIPDRFKEGYGLHDGVVEVMASHRASLLITLDCGVTNVKQIQAVKDMPGTQVIVMDHHRLPDPLPPFDAMLNPKCLDEAHSCADMCTVGVVYMFWLYYREYFGIELDLDPFLDIVAIGTIADIAKISGVNRVLIRQGLKKLQFRERVGLRKLLEVAECDRTYINETDIGFVIAPRLNAAGRLAHAKFGVALLTADSEETALKEAKRLETMNKDRRQIDAHVFDEAKALVEADALSMASPLIIVIGQKWHSGVIGIVASKLVAAYQKPVVVISDMGEVGKGSARTYGTVSVHALLAEFSDWYKNFGGHTEAAGLTIESSKLADFKVAIQKRSQELVSPEELKPVLKADAQLNLHELTLELCESFDALRPFGPGNDRPLFFTDPVRIVEVKPVGKSGAHLKFTLGSTQSSCVVDAIGFNLGDRVASCYEKDVFRFACHLSVNEWRGRKTPQLEIIDFK